MWEECQRILGWVARVLSVIGSSGKGVSGYWVKQQGLFGQVTRESLGIGSGSNMGLS